MILLSTRLILHCLPHLVNAWEKEEKISAKDMSERVGFAARAANENLARLTRANILHSTTGGSSSGYKFVRDPRSIMMSEILEVVDGRKEFFCCKDVLANINCNVDCSKCLMYNVVNDSYKAIMQRLSSLSVYDYVLSRE